MAGPERDAKGHFVKKAKEEKVEEPKVELTAVPPLVGANATPTLPILAAVNDLLAQIRYYHPEVPMVSVVLGAQGATRRGQVHGHFAPNSWEHEDAVHEIMLSGESLSRGAVATLGTLLHESAHAVANARGIKDTSNNGRYHNKRFKAIGEEFGLHLEDAPTLGWSLTTVPEETAAKYQAEVDALAATLVAWRRPPSKGEKKVRKTTKFSVDCGCNKPVTVSKQWFEDAQGRITCNDCLEAFREVGADDEEEAA